MNNRFQKTLAQLEGAGQLRSLQSANGIDLTSNDYLGMRSHPDLRRAALEGIESGMDLGAGGSRLLRGNCPQHEELEHFSAAYFGTEKSLYFATGFQANYALFTTLPGRNDTIVFDEFIHASARDGIQASLARHVRVKHNDLNAYEEAMKTATGQIWIAVESVYSMDGDFAPLKELMVLAQKYNAFLLVDEAHATGVWGEDGKGLCFGAPQQNIITLHTCGKAIGAAGGLICAAAEIIDYMINKARPFIYSTAPMPLQALLVQKSLEILQREPQRREKLFALIKQAKKLFPTSSNSQIIPIILGDDARAVFVAQQLQEAGFDIRAIRPPTVPEGTARLRLSLSSELSEGILREFSAALTPHLRKEAA